MCAAATTAAVGWYYYGTIVPGMEHGKAMGSEVVELGMRSDKLSQEIKRLQLLEEEAAAAREQAANLGIDAPSGSPMIWIAAHLQNHFERFGYAKPAVRFTSAQPEAELPGYQRMCWTIGLPLTRAPRDFQKALLAVAELEKAEPRMRLIEFATLPDPERPGEENVAATMEVFVPE
jgi:hypothetical protein